MSRPPPEPLLCWGAFWLMVVSARLGRTRGIVDRLALWNGKFQASSDVLGRYVLATEIVMNMDNHLSSLRLGQAIVTIDTVISGGGLRWKMKWCRIRKVGDAGHLRNRKSLVLHNDQSIKLALHSLSQRALCRGIWSRGKWDFIYSLLHQAMHSCVVFISEGRFVWRKESAVWSSVFTLYADKDLPQSYIVRRSSDMRAFSGLQLLRAADPRYKKCCTNPGIGCP